MFTAKFHRASDGSPIVVVPTQVISVTHEPDNINAVLQLSDGSGYFIRETVEEAEDKLDSALNGAP